jgi:hypothetical protein
MNKGNKRNKKGGNGWAPEKWLQEYIYQNEKKWEEHQKNWEGHLKEWKEHQKNWQEYQKNWEEHLKEWKEQQQIWEQRFEKHWSEIKFLNQALLAHALKWSIHDKTLEAHTEELTRLWNEIKKL